MDATYLKAVEALPPVLEAQKIRRGSFTLKNRESLLSIKMLMENNTLNPETPLLSNERVKCVIKNAHRLLRHKYRTSPLWVFVGDLTGHGSTVSMMICKQLGLDPHQSTGFKHLQPSQPKDNALTPPNL